MTENFPRRILKFVTESNKCPFDEWLNSLNDKRIQAIVSVRINRLAQGNFGLCRRINSSIWELKIDFGPGIRVYFAEDKSEIVILLCGGNKTTQSKDIKRAQFYWDEYCKE